jgi:hypothetical protein
MVSMNDPLIAKHSMVNLTRSERELREVQKNPARCQLA